MPAYSYGPEWPAANLIKGCRLSNYMEKENGTKLSDRYSINL